MTKKRRKKRFRLLHMIICFLILYVTLIFWNQRNLKESLEVKKQNIISEVEALEKDIENLNKEIENSDTLQFVEKVARDDLGMVKPREIIYIDKNKKKNHFFSIRKNHN